MGDLERERSERASSGDREMIGRLLMRQTPRMRAAARSVGLAAGDVDDAVQEALARALSRWSTFASSTPAPEVELAAWLATIARHVAIDLRRRRERERRRIGARDLELEIERSNGAPPAGTMIPDDAGDPAIPGLDRESLELLGLRYREGLSGGEIAARLGISYEAMKKRLQRARADALARLRGRAP